VTESLLRILKESILATYRVTPRLAAAFSAAARHEDARIRVVAVEASANSLSSKRTSVLEAVVLAGLYDPDEEVIGAALRGMPWTTPLRGQLAPAFVQRLTELVGSYGRIVRAQAVVAAVESVAAGTDDPALIEALAAARLDRSWLVRDPAQAAVV
jgi:hypothetical protein